MKKIIITVLLVFCLYQNVQADDKITYIYEGTSDKVLYIIEQNYIFGSTYGYSKIIARIEKNYIFEGLTSYKVLYRIENNLILEGINSYKLLGRIDGDKVLEGLSTYKILYRIERR
jgi:hypothetical protein